MKQLLPHIITNLGMTFTHDSPTVERIIHYIMRQFKPTESEPLLIYEVEDLNDYGAEFVFLIQFNGDPDSDEDLTEEIPAYLADLNSACNMDESDYAVKTSYDHTNWNQHFILMTICL